MAAGKEPEQLGDFEIIRELGRGGMGVVYEARQASLNRNVALKVLSSGLGLTGKAVLRFKREAEAAARLHHTNIVPIYSTGEENGIPYYAMELIDGPSLDQVIRQLRTDQPTTSPMGSTETTEDGTAEEAEPPAWVAATIGYATGPGSATAASSSSVAVSSDSSESGSDTFDNIARMLAEVADALEHAHDQGVIHRDIKPSNLLLAPDGRLSVNDFGLARVLEQPGMTISGEFVGSPLYMSPEQITAGRLPLDHRTDIYSLGATLYEMLTLKPPFSGQQRDQVLAQIIHKEPVSPRKINKRIPLDLQTICLKALEKDPDRRYQTAGHLADDLRRYVNRHAITARRIGPVGHVVRWAKRHQALSGALGAVLVLLLLAGLFGYQAYLSRQALDAERLDRALNEAIVVAMSGDLEATERKIQEAEKLGAETWFLHMLRGQVKLFLERYDDAIKDLEYALSLQPNSIETQALLAAAYGQGARQEEFLVLEATLSKATPVTTRDKLFLGSWLARLDPQRGIRMLREANAEADARESNLARFLLAVTLSELALEKFDVETAEQATEAAGIARRLMPEMAQAWLIEFRSQQIAAEVLRAADREQAATEMKAQAQQTLDRIKQFPDSMSLANALNLHAKTSDDPAVRLAALRRSISIRKKLQLPVHPSLMHSYALELYLNGKQREAEQVLSSTPNMELPFIPAIILAESEGGVQAAYKLVSQHHAKNGYALAAIISNTAFLLLGKLDEARKHYREINEDQVGNYRDGWYRRLLAYGRGDMTGAELLATVDNQGRSQMNRCEGYFFVGMMKLSQGRRSAADEYFKKCINTGVFHFYEHQFARAILEKRKKDPAWPPWIPTSRAPAADAQPR